MRTLYEKDAVRNLLRLKGVILPKNMKSQALYEMRCACMKKAREVRMAKLAARKKK
jgi:hypothetical protein